MDNNCHQRTMNILSLLLTALLSTVSLTDSMSPSPSPLFRIRTITAFIQLTAQDFSKEELLKSKIEQTSNTLSQLSQQLTDAGYTVQTCRIATNPFGEYLPINDDDATQHCLETLDRCLEQCDITFCSLGPAQTVEEIQRHVCRILTSSPRFSCSVNVQENDLEAARAAAQCIQTVAQAEDPSFLKGGLGNFRFCTASQCRPGIPFFPAAFASSLSYDEISAGSFAIGLENGGLATDLMQKCESIVNIPTTFKEGLEEALLPVDKICQDFVTTTNSDWNYLGIDTSLNPSLDNLEGSVAAAMETLKEVEQFGGAGTVAAAAAMTKVLQTVPGIRKTGYCGYMLPVCEDLRLAELASTLQISNLLAISSVCGVGVDTVPLAGDVSVERLKSLILDVANLAARWDKPLSCRVFPVPNKLLGDVTEFDSPYLCNSEIFDL